MSNVSVEFDQSFPVKKTIIKTTPMMSLKSIVVSACEKFAISDSENYGLKYGRSKELDLSLSIRFANLPAGARLTLIKKSLVGLPTNVTIALQTEEFGRLVQTFPAKTSFWSLLESFELEKNINLTKRSGIPNENNGVWKLIANIGKPHLYLMPIIVFMNREYSNLDDMMKTTLEDAGISSGNGVIRLLYKYDPSSLKDMIVKIDGAKLRNSFTETKALSNSLPIVENIVNTENASQLQEEKILTPQNNSLVEIVDNSNQEGEIDSNFSIDRLIKVYKPIPDNHIMPKFDLPDTFFELSSSELKYVLSNLEHRKNQEENSGFKTKSMREREQVVKSHKYPKTCIRVRFPDQYVLQMNFLSQENVSQLYEVISNSLEKCDEPFSLYVTPPMTILDPQKTFWALSLSPASVVYIGLKNSQDKTQKVPFKLQKTLLETAEPFPIIASIPISDTISTELDDQPAPDDFRVQKSVVIGEGSSESPQTKPRQLPKWLKLGKS